MGKADPPREQTHACETITFPQLRLRVVIMTNKRHVTKSLKVGVSAAANTKHLSLL